MAISKWPHYRDLPEFNAFWHSTTTIYIYLFVLSPSPPPFKIYFNRNIRVRKIDLHSTFNILQFLDPVVLPLFGYAAGGVFIFFFFFCNDVVKYLTYRAIFTESRGGGGGRGWRTMKFKATRAIGDFLFIQMVSDKNGRE